MANPGQLEFAVQPEVAEALGDVVLEVVEGGRVEVPELDGETLGATGLLVVVGRGTGLDFDVTKDLEWIFSGRMGALSPMFAEASQLQAFALPDRCALTPARRPIAAVATVNKFECIFANPIPVQVKSPNLAKRFVINSGSEQGP